MTDHVYYITTGSSFGLFLQIRWHVVYIVSYVFRAKEEARQQQKAQEKAQRLQVETAQAETKAKKERRRQQVIATLPAEPAEGSGDGITKIRFRLPKGVSLERRFKQETPLQVLLDFLVVEGYPVEEFKVISSWPRKDVSFRS